MKPHLVVKLKFPLSMEEIPFWEDFIRDKSIVLDRFGNELDDVFRRFHLDYWITREFRPRSAVRPSEEEVNTGLNRIYRIILQNSTELPDALIDNIRLVPEVEEARSMQVGRGTLPEWSLTLGRQGFYDRPRNNIFLKQAHLFSKGRPEIKIAILDTGIDLDHREFPGIIEKTADFVDFQGLDTSGFIGDVLGYDESPDDEVGHGTHVAGIIAGKGLGMPEGIVPRCRVMVVRVLATIKQGEKRVGAGLIDNINSGIKWAVDNGADVINMSLGVKHEHGGLPHDEVVRYALAKGVTIVAASGNDGTDDKYYPGALPGVIAVGAVDEEDQVASFSTFGRHVALAAPGTNIFSSFVDQGYAVCSGTSQAAPFVTGAVALLKSYGLDLGIRLKDHQVKSLLKHTSDRLDHRPRTEKSGYGRINLVDALKLLQYQAHAFSGEMP